MQHEVEDRLSEQILHGELNSGDHVHVDFKDGEFVFTTTQRALPVAVGVNTGAAIGTGPATPDLAASGSRPTRQRRGGCCGIRPFVVPAAIAASAGIACDG